MAGDQAAGRVRGHVGVREHATVVADMNAEDRDDPGEGPSHKLEPIGPQSGSQLVEPPHPSTVYFAEQLQQLASSTNVRMLDGSNRVRRLTLLRLQKLLREQAPDLPVSQTQIYRYYNGEAPPRLDVVWELAHLFGVSPRVFVAAIGDEDFGDLGDDGSLAEVEPVEVGGQPQLDPPHPSTVYFAQQLQKVAGSAKIRLLDGSNRVRKLTPLRLQKLLKEQNPDLPVSSSQIYRYYRGEAPPRLDVVWEIARLFAISPRYFLPAE
jgi:transcriptional regulator with XRE-family HTH domain